METTLLSALAGIGLAAACGFRVFVPLLVLSLGSRAGMIDVGSGFAWIGTYPALIGFGVATLLEIAGYYIPWVDNLLDAIATPTAIVAGVVVTAAAVGDVSPFLKWTLAVIAGGGAAATFQSLTATARQVSTLTTGGLANPVVSTLEAGGSAVLSVLAVALPLLAFGLVVLCFALGIKKLLFRRPAAAS